MRLNSYFRDIAAVNGTDASSQVCALLFFLLQSHRMGVFRASVPLGVSARPGSCIVIVHLRNISTSGISSGPVTEAGTLLVGLSEPPHHDKRHLDSAQASFVLQPGSIAAFPRTSNPVPLSPTLSIHLLLRSGPPQTDSQWPTKLPPLSWTSKGPRTLQGGHLCGL